MAEIIPAILTADPADLKTKLGKLEGLTNWVSIDIADGKFVANKTLAVSDLAGIQTSLSLEIHLMVNEPEKYFDDCQKAKAKRVVFQLEAAAKADQVLAKAKEFDFAIGIALKPATALIEVSPYLDRIDAVLLLGVDPGWQGQEFIPQTLERIQRLKKMAAKVKIEVDGGINADNIKQVAQAGADILVVGSAIVKQPDFGRAIENLKRLI